MANLVVGNRDQRRALVSARLLLAGGDTDGACNRAYYAMFDTATVALIATRPEAVTKPTISSVNESS